MSSLAQPCSRFRSRAPPRVLPAGAAEWVLARCKAQFNGSNIVGMSDAEREGLLGTVTGMAKRGLRCICLTYTDYPLVDDSRPADYFEDRCAWPHERTD